jgi:hypothetical protein
MREAGQRTVTARDTQRARSRCASAALRCEPPCSVSNPGAWSLGRLMRVRPLRFERSRVESLFDVRRARPAGGRGGLSFEPSESVPVTGARRGCDNRSPSDSISCSSGARQVMTGGGVLARGWSSRRRPQYMAHRPEPSGGVRDPLGVGLADRCVPAEMGCRSPGRYPGFAIVAPGRRGGGIGDRTERQRLEVERAATAHRNPPVPAKSDAPTLQVAGRRLPRCVRPAPHGGSRPAAT